MEKIKKLIKSNAFRELFIYGVVGVLTTVVNYIAYFASTRIGAMICGVSPDHAALIVVANVIEFQELFQLPRPRHGNEGLRPSRQAGALHPLSGRPLHGF